MNTLSAALRRLGLILRWLDSRARGLRRYMAANAAAGIASAGASLWAVWVTKHIVDLAVGRAQGSWSAAVAMLAAAMAVQLAAGAAARRLALVSQTRFSNRLRTHLFDHLMRVRWTGRDPLHSSEGVNRLTADVATASSTAAATLPSVAVTAVRLAAACVFLALLDLRMALAIASIMPVALALSRLYMRRSHALTRSIRRADAALQCTMQESLQHRVLLSTLGHTGRSVDQFARQQHGFYSLVMRRGDIGVYSSTAVTAGFMAGYLAAFLWCAHGLHTGAVTFGMMTAFLQLVAMVQRPVVDLASRVPDFIQASVAIERIDEILALPAEPGCVQSPAVDPPVGLELSGVTFAYPGSGNVIDRLSYTFEPHSLTAIAGPTGKGKTTLLMLILGLLRPGSGHVWLKCADGTKAEASHLTRAGIVYVPQGNSLLSGTIRSNLLMADPVATEQQMLAALDMARAQFVASLPQGLDTPCGERGHGLSEGQAQRIAIARALLRPGSILVLDEPTSALDAATEAALLDALQGLAASRTVIIVSHSPAVLARCGRILDIS